MSTGFEKIIDEVLNEVTGGKLDPDIMDYLDNVIVRAKKADKTVDQCVADFYRYNKDFNQEQEDYLRSRWDSIRV